MAKEFPEPYQAMPTEARRIAERKIFAEGGMGSGECDRSTISFAEHPAATQKALAQSSRQGSKERVKKKAAWFPRRPFLSYGSLTFNGRSQGVRARGPISRLHPDRKPLLIGSVAIPLPEPSRWFPISVR
jgi:hypothetical protein